MRRDLNAETNESLATT